MGEQGARHALPEGVVQSLRDAFAAEVAARLPHLRTLTDPEVARQDAHTLASSAWVVGEHSLSRLARSVEQELSDHGTAHELPALVAALEVFAA